MVKRCGKCGSHMTRITIQNAIKGPRKEWWCNLCSKRNTEIAKRLTQALLKAGKSWPPSAEDWAWAYRKTGIRPPR